MNPLVYFGMVNFAFFVGLATGYGVGKRRFLFEYTKRQLRDEIEQREKRGDA